MKIQILSDLHLEFGMREYDFSRADLLVLAGDIHTGVNGVKWLLSKALKIPVIYVLGNHEYYRHSYSKLLREIMDSARGTSVFILENEAISLEGITFYGCTLWTDFQLTGNAAVASYECGQRMNDYRLIRLDPEYSRLRPTDTQRMHYQSVRWLEANLGNGLTKTNVVVTHHAPSIKSIPPEFQNDPVSAGFASELGKLVLKAGPQLWIHGHIHNACDYMLGDTRIVCNPAGYPFETINGFNKELIIEING